MLKHGRNRLVLEQLSVLRFPFSPLHLRKLSPPQRWFLGCLQIGWGVPRVLGSPRRLRFAHQDPGIALDMSCRPRWCTVLGEGSERWEFRGFRILLWPTCQSPTVITVHWRYRPVVYQCYYPYASAVFKTCLFGTQSEKQDYITLIVINKSVYTSSAWCSVLQRAFRWLMSLSNFNSTSPATVFCI